MEITAVAQNNFELGGFSLNSTLKKNNVTKTKSITKMLFLNSHKHTEAESANIRSVTAVTKYNLSLQRSFVPVVSLTK